MPAKPAKPEKWKPTIIEIDLGTTRLDPEFLQALAARMAADRSPVAALALAGHIVGHLTIDDVVRALPPPLKYEAIVRIKARRYVCKLCTPNHYDMSTPDGPPVCEKTSQPMTPVTP